MSRPPREPSEFPCTLCGAENYETAYIKGPQKTCIDQYKICYYCAYWFLIALEHNPTVIDGRIYSPGRGTTGNYRGMGGRRFDIEYLASGKKITTFDLWCGSTVPAHFRDIFPDTAKFFNGAYAATNSFQHSNGDVPVYSDWEALDDPQAKKK